MRFAAGAVRLQRRNAPSSALSLGSQASMSALKCSARLLSLLLLGIFALLPVAWAQPALDAAPEGAAEGAPANAAQPAPAASAHCPSGNLLAKKPVLRSAGVLTAARMTDGLAPEEGGMWRSALTSVFNDGQAYAIWDLGQETTVRSLLLQGDNNDTYEVSASLDGQSFQPLWTAPQHPEGGMRTRLQQGLQTRARYLRVGSARGDDAYSIGEFMAFCEHPDAWPPPLARRSSEPTKSATVLRAERMTQGKSMLAVLGALTFLGLFLFARKKDIVLLLLAPAAGGGALLYAAWMIQEEAKRLDPAGADRVWSHRALWIAGAAVALLALWLIIRLARQQKIARIAERGALIGLILASAISWVNFGTFHGTRVIHYWDSFHYYMGSKYFKELGYTQLYHCAGVAEIDDGLRAEFAKRQIRDLRDNQLGPALPVLNDDRGCRAAFTPERWAAFRQDLRLFRSHMGASWWAKMFKDHGYNATPAWNLVGHLLSNAGWRDGVPPIGKSVARNDLASLSPTERAAIQKHFSTVSKPAFEDYLGRLITIDFLLYLGIFVLIGWAFGLRACALAMVVWGSGYPWAYFWTGGGFGRVPWLFMATAGLAFLRKGYPLLGGVGLTWSALLRGFPAGFVVGMVLQVARRMVATWFGKDRPIFAQDQVPPEARPQRMKLLQALPISRRHWGFIAGCLLAIGVLIPVSIPVAGHTNAWSEFLDNTAKHKATPLTNHMGLPTLLAYDSKLISRHTRDNKLEDPFEVWKKGRQDTLQSRKVLHYGLLALFAVLLGWAGQRLKDWEVTALSGIFVIGIFELTCYYYSFVIMLAPFVLRRWHYVFVYLGMSLATQIIKDKYTWYDEQYTWETLAILLVYLYFIIDTVVRHVRKLPQDDIAWQSAEAVEAELLREEQAAAKQEPAAA